MTKQKVVYIAGKISGLDLNESKRRFSTVQKAFEKKGYKVVNPHEVCQGLPDDSIWSDYMKECIINFLYVDEFYVLNNYETSKGAKLEILIAESLEIPVYYEKKSNN